MVLNEDVPFIPFLELDEGQPQRVLGARGIGGLNKFVLKRIRAHLEATFPNPEQCAWGVHEFESFYSMAFQVVGYQLSREPFANDPGERWPTGRLYNDGPYIQLQAISVGEVEWFAC
jgi:hypothetical protein